MIGKIIGIFHGIHRMIDRFGRSCLVLGDVLRMILEILIKRKLLKIIKNI